MPAETHTPLVSAVIPVFNRSRFARRAIDSLLTQTLTDIEVVVVDDGSTDETPQVLAELAARDPRVRPFRQDHAGISAAANRGTAEARAELIARLDSDDIAVPDRLERQVEWLEANPSVAVLGGWLVSIDSNDRKVWLHTYTTGLVMSVLPTANPIAHSTAMMRKSVLVDVGGYRPAFGVAQDYDLWLRTAEKADLANIDQVLAYYRMHPGQATVRYRMPQRREAELARILARWRREGRPDPIDQGHSLSEALAMAGIAADAQLPRK